MPKLPPKRINKCYFRHFERNITQTAEETMPTV